MVSIPGYTQFDVAQEIVKCKGVGDRMTGFKIKFSINEDPTGGHFKSDTILFSISTGFGVLPNSLTCQGVYS